MKFTLQLNRCQHSDEDISKKRRCPRAFETYPKNNPSTLSVREAKIRLGNRLARRGLCVVNVIKTPAKKRNEVTFLNAGVNMKILLSAQYLS